MSLPPHSASGGLSGRGVAGRQLPSISAITRTAFALATAVRTARSRVRRPQRRQAQGFGVARLRLPYAAARRRPQGCRVPLLPWCGRPVPCPHGWAAALGEPAPGPPEGTLRPQSVSPWGVGGADLGASPDPSGPALGAPFLLASELAVPQGSEPFPREHWDLLSETMSKQLEQVLGLAAKRLILHPEVSISQSRHHTHYKTVSPAR